MGAWGTGYFESDSACDFWARVRDPNTENPLKEIVKSLEIAIKNEEGYLDISDAESATISSLLVTVFDSKSWLEQTFGDDDIKQFWKDEIITFITCNQDQWDNEFKLKTYDINDSSLTISQLAIQALNTNLDPEKSEASDLWSETDLYDEWKGRINTLIERLKVI